MFAFLRICILLLLACFLPLIGKYWFSTFQVSHYSSLMPTSNINVSYRNSSLAHGWTLEGSMRRIISTEGFKHCKKQAWYASSQTSYSGIMSESLRKLRENVYNPLRPKDRAWRDWWGESWGLKASNIANSKHDMLPVRRPTPGSGHVQITQKVPRKHLQSSSA